MKIRTRLTLQFTSIFAIVIILFSLTVYFDTAITRSISFHDSLANRANVVAHVYLDANKVSAASYRRLLRRDFAADLEFGSRLAKRVFHGRFLFGDVPSRMVQFTRRSPRFSAVMQDLFAGKQPYLGLKRRLLQNLNGSLYEIFMSLGFSHLVPGRLMAKP